MIGRGVGVDVGVGAAAAGRGLDEGLLGLHLLGGEVQVGDGLHQLGLRLLQEPVDVLSTVLGQAGALLLPVPLRSL